MPNKKPLVAVACICEKVLREEGGVLSAIRIVDTFTVHVPEALSEGIQPTVELTALIILKSGDVRGPSEITLRMRTPSGKTLDNPTRYPILLHGEEQGAGVVVTMLLPFKETGYYELGVLWNGELLATIPFRLKPAPAPAAAK